MSESNPMDSSLQAQTEETVRIVVAFVVLGFVAVCLRFYTRIVIVKQFGIEDVSMGIAMVSCDFDRNLLGYLN